MATDNPLMQAVLTRCAGRYPEALPVAALVDELRTAGGSPDARAQDMATACRFLLGAFEVGILELLDAYRRAADARVRQADLDLAVREAEIELELVSGWELP